MLRRWRESAVFAAIHTPRVLEICLVAAASIVATTLIICGTLTYGVNDNMYMGAGMLIARGAALYSDISFFQMPATALWYGALFHTLDGAHAYLFAKLTSALLVVASCLVLGATATWESEHRRFLLPIVVTLLLCNPMIETGAMEAANYSIAMFGLSLAYLLFKKYRRDRAAWQCFLIGLLGGMCVSVRLTYAVFAVVGLLALAWLRPSLGALASFVAGALIGLSPALYYLGLDPAFFFAENVEYHHQANRIRELSGLDTLADAGRGLREVAVALAPAVVAYLLARRAGRAVPADALPRAASTAGWYGDETLLLSATVLMAVAPGVYYAQYWGPPCAFAVLAMARGRAASVALASDRGRVIGTACAVALAAACAARLSYTTIGAASWGVSSADVLSVSRSVADAIAKGTDAACVDTVLTTRPLIAMAGTTPLSRCSSAGTFALQLGTMSDTLSPALAAHATTTRCSEETVIAITLDDQPNPDGIAEAQVARFIAGEDYVPVFEGRFETRPLRVLVPRRCWLGDHEKTASSGRPPRADSAR